MVGKMWAQDVCCRQDFTVTGFAHTLYAPGVTPSRCQMWMGPFFLIEFQNLIKNTYQTHRCLVGSLSSLAYIIIWGLDSRVGISFYSSGHVSAISTFSLLAGAFITALSRLPSVTRWRKREICDFGEAEGKLAIGKRSSTHRDRPSLKNRFPNSCLDCW